MQNAQHSVRHKVNEQFMHSFKKYFMHVLNVPGKVLEAAIINAIDKNPCLHVAYHLLLIKLHSVLNGDGCYGEYRGG